MVATTKRKILGWRPSLQPCHLPNHLATRPRRCCAKSCCRKSQDVEKDVGDQANVGGLPSCERALGLFFPRVRTLRGRPSRRTFLPTLSHLSNLFINVSSSVTESPLLSPRFTRHRFSLFGRKHHGSRAPGHLFCLTHYTAFCSHLAPVFCRGSTPNSKAHQTRFRLWLKHLLSPSLLPLETVPWTQARSRRSPPSPPWLSASRPPRLGVLDRASRRQCRSMLSLRTPSQPPLVTSLLSAGMANRRR